VNNVYFAEQLLLEKQNAGQNRARQSPPASREDSHLPLLVKRARSPGLERMPQSLLLSQGPEERVLPFLEMHALSQQILIYPVLASRALRIKTNPLSKPERPFRV
jgi:hypothetical protein